MKKLLYEFKNRQTINLGGRKRRFIQHLSPSFKVFRDGNTIIHETRQGSIKYSVPNGYRGKITNGNWEDIFDNVNADFFTYEFDTKLKIKKIDEHISFEKDNKIILRLLNVKGIDEKNKNIKVKNIEVSDNKLKYEFDKKVKRVDPEWSWQPAEVDAKDTFIGSGASADINYGASNYFYEGQLSDGRVFLILIQFEDFKDNIPAGSTINTATLSFWYSDGLTGTQSIISRRITQAWVELEVTYNTKPTYDSVDSSPETDCGSDPTVVNILNAVTAICNGEYTDYGWLFTYLNETNNNWCGYHSSASGTAAKRPKLEIDYTEPIQASASSGLKLNESLASQTNYNPVAINEIKLNESSALKTIFNPVLVDGLKLNEEAVKDFYLSTIENLKVNDVSETIVEYNIALSENLLFSDVMQGIGHFFMSISEDFKIDDINITYLWGKVYFSFKVRKSS